MSTILTTWTSHAMPIAVPNVFGGNAPDDVTMFKGRFVAVGGVNAGCCDGGFSTTTRALVWTSTDGARWGLVPDDDVFDLGHMSAVAANDARIVAVGTLNLESAEIRGQIDPVAALWTSTDGRSWSLVDGPPALGTILATDAGFIAARQNGRGPEIWSSPNGLTWARVAGRAELGEGGTSRLVATEEGFLLVGTSVFPPISVLDWDAAIWSSSNGTDWVRVAGQASMARGTLEDAAAANGRYVAVGQASDVDGGLVLTSEDGSHWERSLGPAFTAEGTYVDRVMSVDGSFIVTGWTPDGSSQRPAAWTSSDGIVWAGVPHDALPGFRGLDIEGWLAIDHQIVAVGRGTGEEAGVAPVAWLIR